MPLPPGAKFVALFVSQPVGTLARGLPDQVERSCLTSCAAASPRSSTHDDGVCSGRQASKPAFRAARREVATSSLSLVSSSVTAALLLAFLAALSVTSDSLTSLIILSTCGSTVRGARSRPILSSDASARRSPARKTWNRRSVSSMRCTSRLASSRRTSRVAARAPLRQIRVPLAVNSPRLSRGFSLLAGSF